MEPRSQQQQQQQQHTGDNLMSSVDIPAGYLDNVEIRAYHLDLTLHCCPTSADNQQQITIAPTPTFSARVRILATVTSGPPRNVFYLHSSSTGLDISRATIVGVRASVVVARGPTEAISADSASDLNSSTLPGCMRLEVPAHAAIHTGADFDMELEYTGKIRTRTPEGVSILRRQSSVERFRPLAMKTSTTDDGSGSDNNNNNSDNSDSNNNTETNTGSSSSHQHQQHQHQHQQHQQHQDNISESFFPTGSVLGTHLEPTHARDLFPCVDLPSCKAVFHLVLRGVPRHLQTVSNSPISRIDNYESDVFGDASTNSGVIPTAQLHLNLPPSRHYPRHQHQQREVSDAAAVRVGASISFTRKTQKLKTVVFEQTPVMPTYIFGFWVGDFHSLTTTALATEDSRTSPMFCCGGTPVPALPDSSRREVTIHVQILRPTGLEGARFALDFSKRAFDFFSRLFSVPYPLPKLDVLGLPRMHGLGMENFGAITLLENYMLVTDQTSFVRRRRIARLICHEVCHQWYGDIVTPQSFDELWLKEGLARFFEYVAVDALDSSYRVWTNFMREVFFQAMLADAQKESHAVVQQHNGNIASILESFDTITYCKGASVLRMLCHCVGPARFLEGTRRFVVDHQFASATQEDLWKAVQGVCDRDHVAINVRDLMRTWLTCERFPVLHVRIAEGTMATTTLNITQQPFSFYGAASDTSASSSSTTQKPNVTSGCDSKPDVVGQPVAAAAEEVAGAGGEQSGVDKNCAPTAVVSGSGESGGGGLRWVIPLRVRVGDGSVASTTAAAPAMVGGGAARTECSFIRESTRGVRGPEEVVHRIMMTQESMPVVLRCLPTGTFARGSSSTPPPAVPGAAQSDPRVKEADDDAEGGKEPVRGEMHSGDKAPGEGGGRPYLVINDEHSGFFTVQYECERSWALALAALEDGILSDCEAMGFVHDLILGLHEGVLVNRGVLGVAAVTDGISMSAGEEGLAGGGSGGVNKNQEGDDHGSMKKYCTVPRLFARLRHVVRILARDRSHPAWCPGQLFVWELLLVCASNALADVEKLRARLLGESLAAAQRHLDAVSTRGKEADAVGAAAAGRSPPRNTTGDDRTAEVHGEASSAGGEARGRREEATAGDTTRELEFTEAGVGSSSTVSQKGGSTCTPMEVDAGRLSATDDDASSYSSVVPEKQGGVENQTSSDEASMSHGDDGGGGGRLCLPATAVLGADSWRTKAEAVVALSRVVSVLKDIQQAVEEVEEHMWWHNDRVSRGEKQAAEAGESLAAMRDCMNRMMQRCVAQLSQIRGTVPAAEDNRDEEKEMGARGVAAAAARNAAPPMSTSGDVCGANGDSVAKPEQSELSSPPR